MKNSIIFLAVSAICLPVVQGQTLMTGFWSKHAERCQTFEVPSTSPRKAPTIEQGQCFEGTNTGIGYRQDTGPWSGWAVGMYHNSISKTSVYVAREWLTPGVTLADGVSAHAGVIVGGATGYKLAVTPVIMPEVVVRVHRAEVALLVQPFDLDRSPAFIALQARWRFQ